MAPARQVSDEQIVRIAADVIADHGPEFTLAQVGERVSLSATTVVQRFGTRRALRLQVAAAPDRSPVTLPLAGDGDPVDSLIASLAQASAWMGTPDRVANVMAVLHTDLVDPDFHEVIADASGRRHETIVATLEQAVASGALKRGDCDALAKRLQAIVLGAHQSWAITPTGELVDWLTECLEAALAPWRIIAGDTQTDGPTAGPNGGTHRG